MPRALLLYHYFHPDDVVSAVQFSELAAGLRDRGWKVTAIPSNRECNNASISYPSREQWNGIEIRRIWRPRFRQSSSLGRLLNALWMVTAWSLQPLLTRHVDVVIVGTDPVLGVLAVIPWKLFRPKVKIAHWCFDLYPEAAIADEILRPESLPARLIRSLLRRAYKCCDLLVDIGPCMKRALAGYSSKAHRCTLTPWALSEPPTPVQPPDRDRERLFPGARLCLLYSGTFGRAHSFGEFLSLARLLRDDGIHFGFAVRGNRAEELRAAIGKADTNIHFLPFVPQDQLERQLSLGDIHLTSLRREWTGTVVPSKFFGSLAIGRPVLFAGDAQAASAQWIEEHKVGWLLTAENVPLVAQTLRQLASDQQALQLMIRHCQNVYRKHFSRRRILDQWDANLRGALAR